MYKRKWTILVGLITGMACGYLVRQWQLWEQGDL